MMYYQWTVDGDPESVLKESVLIDKPVECYHCGCIIPSGKATKLTTLSDNCVYMLHDSCAKKSCCSR